MARHRVVDVLPKRNSEFDIVAKVVTLAPEVDGEPDDAGAPPSVTLTFPVPLPTFVALGAEVDLYLDDAGVLRVREIA